MKKKQFFITIISLLFSLTGCKLFEKREVSPVYITNFLNRVESPSKDPNGPTFTLKGQPKEGIYDYDLEIRNALLEKTKGVNATQIEGTDNTEPDLYYLIRCVSYELSYCNIYLYSNGKITTSAYGDGWSAPKSQFFEYTISQEDASYIIGIATNKYNEIKEDYKNEKEVIDNEEALTNFFNQINESTKPATIDYCETRKNYERYTFTVQDKDKQVLDKLNVLVFEDIVSDDASKNLPIPTIEYYLNEDWKLQIYCIDYSADYSVASLQYKYNGKFKAYYPCYFYKYYFIDDQKGSEIADIVRSMQTK